MTIPKGYIYERMDCPFPDCKAREVSPQHYFSTHNLTVFNHFKRSKGGTLKCAHCGQGDLRRSHGVVRHLVAEHPEVLNSSHVLTAMEGKDARLEAALAVTKESPGVVLGELFTFLVDERREAERLAADVRQRLDSAEGKVTEMQAVLEQSRNFIAKQGETLDELQTTLAAEVQRRAKLQEQNYALLEEISRLKAGLTVERDLRSIYAEYRGAE